MTELVFLDAELPEEQDVLIESVCPACHRVVKGAEDHHGWCVEGLRVVAEQG
jgi:hypothetical protein